MDEFLIVATTPMDTEVYLSELSAKTLADNGLLQPSGGLYLYEACDEPGRQGIRVLASVPDTDSGYRLLELLGKAAA